MNQAAVSEAGRACNQRRWILLLALGFLICGGVLRFIAIDRVGLTGSDNTLHTNIAKSWSEGEPVYRIGEIKRVYRPVVFGVFGLVVRILGFNDASIKIANAGLDTMNILLVFILTFILSRRNPWAATSATAVYALLPFTILISRSELTHIVSTTTVLIGLILLSLSWFTENRPTRLILLALAGVAIGLSALTHEELIFTAVGPALLLVLKDEPRSIGLRSRVISAMSQAGIFLAGVVPVAFHFFLIHQTEAYDRAAGIVGGRVAGSRYWNFLEHPLKYGWNAVTGASSTWLACLVIVLILVLVSRFCLGLERRRMAWSNLTPPLEDLPLWTVIGYLLLYASFFNYYAVRLFLPLIPLVIVWLIVRTASLTAEEAGRRASTAVLAGLTVTLVAANLGHVGAIRDFQHSHFKDWAPFSFAADLRPDLGWSELRKRLTTPSWPRQRFEELKHVVDEDARLLVGASVFHPFPGRRTLQIGYYFADNAVYLFDHDQPLDQLIDDKNIKFVLFTTHQTYDRRAIEWVEHQRYRYRGRWGAPESFTLGASIGLSDGEYTIRREFERLRADMAGRGARIIYGQGELLKKRPMVFRPSSFVVWALDPTRWPPLGREIEAISSGLEQASAGRLDEAIATLEAAEAGTSTPGRFRLRFTGARILAEQGLTARARRHVAGALSLAPRNTTLCTFLSEALPTRSTTQEAHRLFADILEAAPGDRAVRNLVIALVVNLAEFAIVAGDRAESVDAFQKIKHHLATPGDRLFTVAVADWCATRARSLAREGRSPEARAGLTTASNTYLGLLASDRQPNPALLLRTGTTLTDLGRHDEAARTLSKASVADPTNPVIWSNLCLALSRVENEEQGLKACGTALTLEPDNTLAATMTARLLGQTRRWSEASDQLMDLLARSTAELNGSTEVDRLASVAGDLIDGLIAHGDTSAAAQIAGALGRFLSDRARHDTAVDVLLDATDLTPDVADLWANLCLAHQRAGHPTAALESCRQALELNEEHFWARILSAEILASGEQWPAAIQQARAAARSAPPRGEHARRLIRFAQGAAEAGHSDQACELLTSIEHAEAEAVTGNLEALICNDGR